ncbi:MAG TPA: AAA family ATPase [Acidimicrobiales bacterium]|nr:AAA family ATPase [Acidimicrobiales bacterium]
MSEGGDRRAGTVTVVFTDLVDSTLLRKELGDDRADEIRREHDQIVRRVTAEHGGTEVKALGDGFMLSFHAAAEAVAAAIAVQQGVEQFARRSTVPVSVRIGASAGDVVWEDGDCFGTPVVEASRLCDFAVGKQIVVSEVVRLLAGSRGDHHFNPIGPVDLKGLSSSVSASEVAWEAPADEGIALPGALRAGEHRRFVGRVAARDQLTSAWKDAATGARRVALISGEPGVGKTRLAAEVARAAHTEGATVLYGRCDEELGVPYQPFVEALRPYVLACSPDELAEQVAPHGGDLARLLPQIAERVPDLPDPLRADPETERFRLFEAITSFLTRMGSAHAVVLVLDDLHWAAKPTLLLLRHLATADASPALLILGTYRETDLSRTHPLAEMLADLRRSDDVDRVALHGLDLAEVEEFVTTAAGHVLDDDGERLVRLLYDETDGNPFFMGQVLQHLVESGAIVEHDGRWVPGKPPDEIGIPEGVREVVGRRLARLRASTNEVMAAAAVIGRDFDRDVLTRATDVDPEAVLDALEEAEEANLVAVIGGRGGRYSFVHAIVRSTLYEEIPTTRRLRLHRRIGETLEASDADRYLDELAYHFAEAAALGETDRAIDYGRRAAERAIGRLAYEEAAADFERALTTLDPTSREDRERRAELLVELGRVLWTFGERLSARRRLAEARTLSLEVHRPDLLAEAAITSGGVRAWTEAGRVDEPLVELLEEALAELPAGDLGLRAMAMARLAAELYFLTGSVERRSALIADALAMARRIGDGQTLAYVLGAAHWGIFMPGNAQAREAIAQEMLSHSEASGDRNHEAAAHSWLFTDLVELGDIPAATEQAELEFALAEELRQPELRWGALIHKSALALLHGELDEGQSLAEEALALSERVGIQSGLQMYGVADIALRRLRGGLEELVPLAQAMVEEYPLVPAWRSGLAYVYRELGLREEAREQLEFLAADDFARLTFDGNWTVGAAILSTVCHMVGDKRRAAMLYERFSPLEDCFVGAGLPADILGSAHHFLMLLAATTREWDRFDRHAAQALSRHESMDARPWLATTQVDIASVLVERGFDGDAERADELLRACLTTCAEIGMPALARRAKAVQEGLARSP